MSGQEFELSLRDKEMIMRFRHYLKQHGIQIFSGDDLQKFVKTKEGKIFKKQLKDSKGRLNSGPYFREMLKTRNPRHRIKWVAWDSKGSYNRRIGQYEFVEP